MKPNIFSLLTVLAGTIATSPLMAATLCTSDQLKLKVSDFPDGAAVVEIQQNGHVEILKGVSHVAPAEGGGWNSQISYALKSQSGEVANLILTTQYSMKNCGRGDCHFKKMLAELSYKSTHITIPNCYEDNQN